MSKAAELAALIDKATDDDLSDNGRYFHDSLQNFTSCNHGDCGEFGAGDGELTEWLWNNRKKILALYQGKEHG